MSAARIRATSPDPFNGARGHDYIRLRGLQPKTLRAAEIGDQETCPCAACLQARMLPAVQRICAAAGQRLEAEG